MNGMKFKGNECLMTLQNFYRSSFDKKRSSPFVSLLMSVQSFKTL